MLMLCITSFAYADKTISDEDYNKLPQDVRSEIETKQNVQKLGEYAGLGKEIGTAVNESLKAIESSVVRVSNTDLGKTAIFIVCWKLLYKDFIGIFVGCILITIWTYMLIKGSRVFNIYNKEDREEVMPFENLTDDGQCGVVLVYAFSLIVLFIASLCCIF